MPGFIGKEFDLIVCILLDQLRLKMNKLYNLLNDIILYCFEDKII